MQSDGKGARDRTVRSCVAHGGRTSPATDELGSRPAGLAQPGDFSHPRAHQKPLEFMHRILNAVTDPGDVIWEPFGGLASASVAAVQAGRFPCVAELDPGFAELAAQRLIDAHRTDLG
jgi:DNA modification methylase